MSGKVRRIDFHPDEYITGVGGVLTAEQQGVYWMICATIMSEGGPIPLNERRIAALCLMRPSRLKSIIDLLIQEGKLSLTEEGKLYQKRALSEIERSEKRIQKAKENGSKGGRPALKSEQNQQNSEPGGLFVEKLTKNQEPRTTKDISNLRTKPPKRRYAYTDRFEVFWSSYPTDSLMSKAEAGKAFEKLSEDDQELAIASLPAFKAYCSAHSDYRVVHANRFLSQRRFEGFSETQKKVDSRKFVEVGSKEWQAILRARRVSSMPHTEREGRNGWSFDLKEISQAMSAEMDWREMTK